MNREILHGDVLDKLAAISDETIDVIISSPPYWGLRDYSVEGQLGLEPDFHDYLNTMQKVMDGLKRVLKPTGTCWINLGDTYKNKSLVAIPERFYVRCLDDGWLSRNHNVWVKNNAMPSSVKDRFTKKWESVFFFTKHEKYYFDLDAVRVPTKTASKPFNVRVRDSDTQRFLQGATDIEKQNHNGKGERKYNGEKLHSTSGGHTGIMDHIGGSANNPKGKNPSDIFQINPKPFPEAHFATFPLELPLKILKCACPKNGIVLDPFFGAGTVGLAAEKLGLNWIGIELNAEYIKIAQNRLSKYMNNRIEAFV